MAEVKINKKETEVLNKEEVKEEQKAEQTVSDYENELVDFYAIYDGDKYKDDIFVGINGRTWLIKRGETVKIPRYVYNVIKSAEDQKISAMKYKEEQIRNRNSIVASI